jgi:hypothetical protein
MKSIINIPNFYKNDPHYITFPNMYPSLIINKVRIAFSTSINSKITYIEGIDSTNRKLGLASKALDYFTSLSKKNGFSVRLNVYQEDKNGLSIKQLKKWYIKHGFIKIENSNTYEFLTN